jgi:hypothetical protein
MESDTLHSLRCSLAAGSVRSPGLLAWFARNAGLVRSVVDDGLRTGELAGTARRALGIG